MKTMLLMVLAVCVGLSSGCASIATNAVLTRNEAALKVKQMGDGAMVSVDLLSLDAVKKHPGKSLVAALADAAMAWGVYELGKAQEWWGDDEDEKPAETTPKEDA